MVANDVSEPGSGFSVDTNRVTLVDSAGAIEVPAGTKAEVAHRILDHVVALRTAAANKPAPRAPKGGLVRSLMENIEALAIAIVMALVLKYFLIEAYKIPTGSMQPGIMGDQVPGIFDRVLVNKLVYLLREPERYEVVVFKNPLWQRQNYIKRLIGLPGDHIVVQDDHLFVDGEPMPVRVDGIYEGQGQSAARNSNARIGTEQLGKVEHRVLFQNNRPARDYDQVVPEGHYFFMGDNRDNSQDSRFAEVGFVPEGNLVGKAVRIWLNWDLPDAPIWSRIGDPIR